MPAHRANQALLEAMLGAFRRRFETAVPFREDRVLGEDLVSEVSPVLDALLTSHHAGGAALAAHEAYALVTLLSRRAGLMGATPTAALSLSHSLVAALAEAQVYLPQAAIDELAMVVLEGYSAGREERITRELKQVSAQRQVLVALAPQCFAVFLAGRHEADFLAPVLDGFARDLLRADARSCLVDLSRLVPEGEELARHLVGFCATNVAMGARVVVYGVEPHFRADFERLAFAQTGAELVHDADEARSLTLRYAGYELKSRTRWPRQLFTRARSGTRS